MAICGSATERAALEVFHRLTAGAAPVGTAESILSSTLSGRGVEPEPVPPPSKYVQMYDATTFQEAFGMSKDKDKGVNRALLAEYEVSDRRPPAC